jgi:biotin synthesis protein BioG
MKTHIRRRQDSEKLIIVFGGWGIDQNAFLPLCTESHDFILYYNYSADEPLVLPDRKTYRHIVLIGWSLGVWAAEYMSESMNLNPDLTIAVNGTPIPVDDKYGIPLDTFEDTLNNMDESGINRFNLHLFGTKTALEENADKLSKRSIDSYGAELRWLYNRIMENPDKRYKWDIAVSSINDLVFPSRSQNNYWSNRKDTRHIKIDLPHYPFHHWGNFDIMIKDLLNKSGLNFSYK